MHGSNRTNVGLKPAVTALTTCAASRSNRTNVGLKRYGHDADAAARRLKSDQCGIETDAVDAMSCALALAQIGPMWD